MDNVVVRLGWSAAPAQHCRAANHVTECTTSITSLTAGLPPVRQVAHEERLKNSIHMHGRGDILTIPMEHMCSSVAAALEALSYWSFTFYA